MRASRVALRLSTRPLLQFAPARRYFPENGFRFFDGPQDSLGGDAVPNTISLTLTRQDEFLHKQTECTSITIRTAEGEMGILAGHEYSIEQLAPGVLDVEIDNEQRERWAISGGFAHVNDNGIVDINCVEAVQLKDIDAEKVAAALDQARANLGSADDMTRIQAEIAMEVFEPLDAALKAH
eukprot:NODE_3325_length_681_cov_559.471519_g2362_i0.p1 GENE.NODE_3325_length_681_cov_559.471519_g2362_i0~~NODE_3325_length_681_cov_559.471519_g2362_i0.p1  ORF type:complete len:198 (+),score=98.97 NODE_3325_length_681_cov_559.471519_g2362_i0:52-594(+)